MSDLTDINGNAIPTAAKCVLTLEMDLATGRLKIGGELGNLDMALNLLAQATRYIESQYRNQQTLLFQQQMERDHRLLSRVMS